MCYTPFDKGESSFFLGTVNILLNDPCAKRRDFLDGVNRSYLLACEDGKKHPSQTIDHSH
jgi:hypothetical protein